MDPKSKLVTYLCQTRLDCFARMAFGWLHPEQEYKHHWPMDVLGDALTRCLTGECKRLIVNMPPRSLKSFYASVALPAWTLAHKPQTKIMCVAGDHGLAEDHHQMSLRLMKHPNYRSLFPHLRISESNRTIRLGHGGSRSAHIASPGGGLTGRGADIIIVDDPLGASYAEDDNRREETNLWYDRNVYQRLNNKKDGAIIVVMQRLHVDDLTGHLLKQDGWTLLRFPAIAMEDESYLLSDGRNVGRRIREALHPALENRDLLLEVMHRIGARPFMAQYQQKPYPPGEGKGLIGKFRWYVSVDVKRPTVRDLSFAVRPEPQEDMLEAEVFNGTEYVPCTSPGLRLLTDEEEEVIRQDSNPRPAEVVEEL